MLNVILFISSLVHLTTSTNPNVFCKRADIPDYYWRDYKGVIPYDAVPGGTNRAGFATYIGQALIQPYGELTVTIYQGNATVIGSAAIKAFYTDKDVKILCSGSPEKFKWIATEIPKIQLITQCQLIFAGNDRGHPLNVGRGNYKGEIKIGKVLTTGGTSNGLWIPGDEIETNFANYEVLAYDCKPDNYVAAV